MDPLSVLRTFVVNNELDQVVESADSFDFGGRFSFPKTGLTAYRSDKGRGEFYDLQTVVFYMKEGISLKLQDYLRQAKERGVKTVKLLDKKDLEGYLTGAKETSEFVQHAAAAAALEAAAPAAKRARVEEAPTAAAAAPAAPVSALAAIAANERQLRDRNTMLSVPGRSFQRVLDLLEGVLSEEQAHRAASDGKDRAARDRDRAEDERRRREALGARSSGRYQRETAPEAGLQQMGAQNLGLQEMGFGVAAEAAGAPPPPPPPASLKAPAPAPASRPRPPSGSGGARAPPPPARNRTPIIMVPPAATAMLNILNAREFLEGGQFRTVEAAVAAGAVAPPHGYHSIRRTIGRPRPVKYHVTDKEPRREEDWSRVVGVVCLGKPWQFKRFPFAGAAKGDLAETFQRVCGVYLHYSDEPVDPQVKKWNVKLIRVGRHSRDGDAEAAREFWTHLDAFIRAHDNRDVEY